MTEVYSSCIHWKAYTNKQQYGYRLSYSKIGHTLFEVCAFDGQFSACSPSECGPLLIIVLPHTTLPNTFNE